MPCTPGPWNLVASHVSNLRLNNLINAIILQVLCTSKLLGSRHLPRRPRHRWGGLNLEPKNFDGQSTYKLLVNFCWKPERVTGLLRLDEFGVQKRGAPGLRARLTLVGYLLTLTYAVMSRGSLVGSIHTSSDCLWVRWVNGYAPFALCRLTSSQSLGVGDVGRLPAMKRSYMNFNMHACQMLPNLCWKGCVISTHMKIIYNSLDKAVIDIHPLGREKPRQDMLRIFICNAIVAAAVVQLKYSTA